MLKSFTNSHNSSFIKSEKLKFRKELTKMKKLFSLVLVAVLALSMCVTAFAAVNNDNSGVITLNPDDSIASGTKYTAYQILVLESYSGDHYSYKPATGWSDFFATGAAGAQYMTVNSNGYATWTASDNSAAKMQAFARAAVAYATTNNIAGTTQTYDGTNDVKWENLNLGYYVVDSDAGILCNLTTTAPTVAINGKNKVLIEKTAKEAADENDTYSADGEIVKIGDTVNFKIEVTIYAGAEGYVLHDKMSAGLTLDAASIVLKNGDTTLTAGTDYTLATENLTHNDCTFEITFAQTYLDAVSTALGYDTTASQTVVVTYNAVLNANAVIEGEDGVNKNDAKLEYGDDHETDWDTVTVKTFEFDLIKYDGATKAFLDGAEFVLYAADQKTVIDVVKVSDTEYRVATEGETTADSIVVTGGKVTIEGLDAQNTYYLKETVAPTGYNLLVDFVEVKFNTVSDAYVNNVYTYTGDEVTVWHDGNGGVAVENNAGTILPSTGSTGTTLFIVFGSIVALSAFVVLVARKKSAGYTV